MQESKKRPPYTHQLHADRHGLLVVCTGADAWRRAQLPTWYPRVKVVLPPGDDPNHYDWRIAAGCTVVIFGCGELEPIDTVARLGGLLLAAMAKSILYVPEHGPMTRIIAQPEVG